jgi:Baseplate J-like protein
VSQEIRDKLSVTAPGFSMELGTPERKVVDAVAESISECYVDQYLVGSLLDIESKTGLELEQFVGIFGFGRLQGRQATGVVRVELNAANAQDMPINVGTQFFTRQGLPGTANPLYFSATQSTVIPAGTYVADVPVQCTVIGTSGNVPPDSIVYLGEIIGASSVTNLTSMTGGVDAETDDELRQRFKDTLLRNIAGTEDWYLGLAYQNINVSKAMCVGPIRKYATQINVPSVALTLPVSADVKYAWPDGESVFSNLGQDNEIFYRPIDDYNFISGSSPQIVRVASGQMVVDDVVDVEFEYTTRCSRNDPTVGICNKVDVFVNGAAPFSITERTVLTATTLSTNSADPLWVSNFARVGTAGNPSATNRFMRLGSVPVLSFPSSIVVGTTNFQQGVHYHILRGTTLDAGSIREVAGLEWLPAGPAVGTPLTLTYIYNRVPEVLQAILKQNKQITTDVLTHQASYAYLRIYLSLEYSRGFVVSQVNNAVQTRLQTYFAGLPFGVWIQISDLSLAVHQVIGVDNVNLTTSIENPADYGIKVYGDSSDTVPIVIQTDDFKLVDSQLPVFMEAICLRKPNR